MTTSNRPGRPVGSDGSNRQRILDAAREEFGVNGFRGTTMRSIAVRAGVDVALLAHYFGGKDGLFTATLEFPERATAILTEAFHGDPAGVGERLTRGYLRLWEDPATGPQMQIAARSAVSNEQARAAVQEHITAALAGPEVVGVLAGRETGLALAMSHLLGIAVGRYLTRQPLLTALDFDDLIARVAPATQLYLTGSGA